jgi:hypothetical protein
MIFIREVMASFNFKRRSHDRLQHAVNTEADAEFFFVGLDVDVAGSPLHGVAQNHVHELDDGSFIGRFFQLGQLHLLLFGLQFHVAVAHFRHRLHHRVKIFLIRGAVGFFNARPGSSFPKPPPARY